MNNANGHVARLTFKVKMLEASGQAFEDLFTNIMAKATPEFQQVKPQGRIGDRSNDGFIKSSGIYYQVYSPEDPSSKLSDAIKKLNADFKGLHNYWNSLCLIREFYFVFNDKYKGAFPELHKELLLIQDQYKLDKVDVLVAKDLETLLFKLSDADIDMVVGPVSLACYSDVSFSALNEVVEYLFKNASVTPEKESYVVPDFDKKIVFNKLCPEYAQLLLDASYRHGDVDDFFSRNGEFARNNLRDIYKGLYDDGINEYTSLNDKKNDSVFVYVLSKSYPKGNDAHKSASLVLMAYFFECCDIFEEPSVDQ